MPDRSVDTLPLESIYSLVGSALLFCFALLVFNLVFGRRLTGSAPQLVRDLVWSFNVLVAILLAAFAVFCLVYRDNDLSDFAAPLWTEELVQTKLAAPKQILLPQALARFTERPPPQLRGYTAFPKDGERDPEGPQHFLEDANAQSDELANFAEHVGAGFVDQLNTSEDRAECLPWESERLISRLPEDDAKDRKAAARLQKWGSRVQDFTYLAAVLSVAQALSGDMQNAEAALNTAISRQRELLLGVRPCLGHGWAYQLAALERLVWLLRLSAVLDKQHPSDRWPHRIAGLLNDVAPMTVCSSALLKDYVVYRRALDEWTKLSVPTPLDGWLLHGQETSLELNNMLKTALDELEIKGQVSVPNEVRGSRWKGKNFVGAEFLRLSDKRLQEANLCASLVAEVRRLAAP